MNFYKGPLDLWGRVFHIAEKDYFFHCLSISAELRKYPGALEYLKILTITFINSVKTYFWGCLSCQVTKGTLKKLQIKTPGLSSTSIVNLED